jgi:hypothetical protein
MTIHSADHRIKLVTALAQAGEGREGAWGRLEG